VSASELRQRRTTGDGAKWEIWKVSAQAAVTPCSGVDYCRNFWEYFYRARCCQKPQICRWNFDPIYHKDISISGFGSRIDSRLSASIIIYLGTLSLSLPWRKASFIAKIATVLYYYLLVNMDMLKNFASFKIILVRFLTIIFLVSRSTI